MRAALVTVGIAAAAVAAGAGDGRASHDSCHPTGTRSIQSAPQGRVYEARDEQRWACTYRFGRSYAIDYPIDDVDSGHPYVFAGRYFASWVASCDAVSACASTIAVR